MAETPFVREHRLALYESRVAQAARLLRQGGRVPVAMDVDCAGVELEQHKYAVPGDVTVAAMQRIARANTQPPLTPAQALYPVVLVYASETTRPTVVLPPTGTTLAEAHRAHRSNDLNVYLVFRQESTFG